MRGANVTFRRHTDHNQLSSHATRRRDRPPSVAISPAPGRHLGGTSTIRAGIPRIPWQPGELAFQPSASAGGLTTRLQPRRLHYGARRAVGGGHLPKRAPTAGEIASSGRAPAADSRPPDLTPGYVRTLTGLSRAAAAARADGAGTPGPVHRINPDWCRDAGRPALYGNSRAGPTGGLGTAESTTQRRANSCRTNQRRPAPPDNTYTHLYLVDGRR